MRLYFCRSRQNPSKYLRNITQSGRGLAFTDNIEEAGFSQSYLDAMETVSEHPELEVCCFDGVLVTPSPKNTPNRMNIPGVDALEVQVAIDKFSAGLQALNGLCPTSFNNQDDAGTVLEFKGFSYDHMEGQLYIDLGYPVTEKQGRGLSPMSLGG